MPSGIIVIDKSQGWTSMDVCAKLRGIFREKFGISGFADLGLGRQMGAEPMGLKSSRRKDRRQRLSEG